MNSVATRLEISLKKLKVQGYVIITRNDDQSSFPFFEFVWWIVSYRSMVIKFNELEVRGWLAVWLTMAPQLSSYEASRLGQDY